MLKSLLFLLLITAQIIAQTTYYVSSSQGNDSNNGTSQSSPWKSVNKVNLFSFNPGDKILFKKGDTWRNQPLLLDGYHTGIMIGSYGSGNKPIIRGDTIYNANAFVARDNIIVDGIHFQGSSTGIGAGSNPRGITLSGDGVTIRNCIVEGDEDGSPRSDAGISITSKDVTIENNEIYWHLRLIHSNYTGSSAQNLIITNNILRDTRSLGANDGDCIKFSGGGNAEGTRIAFNDMSGWSDDAIDGRVQHLLIEYNDIHNPQEVSSGTGIKFGYMPESQAIGGNEQSRYGIARYNIIRDFNITHRPELYRGWAIHSGSSDQEIYYNLIYNINGSHGISKTENGEITPHNNIKIYNNTIWNVGGSTTNGPTNIVSTHHALFVGGNAQGVQNLEIRNNIIKGKGGSYRDIYYGASNATSTNNVFVNNNIYIYPGVTVSQSDNQTGSPAFINLSSNNYRLAQNDTKAKDKGRLVTGIPPIDLDSNLVPFNSLTDIGAYEYGSTGGGSNSINVNIKILLEGSFDNGSMATTLLNDGHLPLAQPYNQAPWNYNGNETVSSIPSGVVDWVLLELRTGTSSSTSAGRKAAFVKSDGSVVALDGLSKVSFDGLSSGSYYVVVRHRNHLDVMSANPLSLSDNSALYDFTTGPGKAYGTDPMSDLGNGMWGMTAGDGDLNGLVNVIDYGTVGNFLFIPGYEFGDLDMNGIINVMDYAKTNLNLFRNSQVP